MIFARSSRSAGARRPLSARCRTQRRRSASATAMRARRAAGRRRTGGPRRRSARLPMIDVNFDGIPGPTHNYAGLARGNLAAEKQRAATSRIRAKPRCRGSRKCARSPQRGYAAGRAAAARAARSSARCARSAFPAATPTSSRAPRATRRRCSPRARRPRRCGSANAATVSPSADTADGRVHFTPANLVAHFHRSLEAPTTTRDPARDLRRPDALRRPRSVAGRAAVRRRGRGEPHAIRGAPGAPGVEFFVYGRAALRRGRAGAARNFPRGRRAKPRRRSRAATASIPRARVFAQQHPGRDRRRRVPQRRDRGRPRQRAVLPRAGVGRAGRACWPSSRGDRRGVRADRRAASASSPSPMPSPPICSTASCCARATAGYLLVAPAECRENARVARVSRPLVAQRRADRRGARHSTCARACATAAVRRACGLRVDADRRRACRDRARACSSTTRSRATLERGSARTIATALRRRTSPIRRSSTNRGARSTS